jgi:hypothetical protein
LNRNRNPIITSAAFLEIVGLEVECGFVEPISVRDVMDGIDDEESIDPRGIQIIRGSRVLSRVVGVDKIERTG